MIRAWWLAMAVLVVTLGGCASPYTLVPASSIVVAHGTIRVDPGIAWNRMPPRRADIAWEENWTANGPALDAIGFIGALPDGEAIVRQRRGADRRVPVFRATMTPSDLVSMIETACRIRAGAAVFETLDVQPARLLGHAGIRFDFAYVGPDEIRRRGRVLAAVIDGRLYALTLDGAALHYFGAALVDFDRIAASARPGAAAPPHPRP